MQRVAQGIQGRLLWTHDPAGEIEEVVTQVKTGDLGDRPAATPRVFGGSIAAAGPPATFVAEAILASPIVGMSCPPGPVVRRVSHGRHAIRATGWFGVTPAGRLARSQSNGAPSYQDVAGTATSEGLVGGGWAAYRRTAWSTADRAQGSTRRRSALDGWTSVVWGRPCDRARRSFGDDLRGQVRAGDPRVVQCAPCREPDSRSRVARRVWRELRRETERPKDTGPGGRLLGDCNAPDMTEARAVTGGCKVAVLPGGRNPAATC